MTDRPTPSEYPTPSEHPTPHERSTPTQRPAGQQGVRPGAADPHAPGADAGLEVRGATVDFRVRRGTLRALDAVDLTVPAGTLTAVLGPSGCGKSTLLRGLVRLLRPTSGQVLLDGDDLHRIPTRQVATTIGLLPQQPLVPAGLTVAELVSRGRHPHRAAWRPASRTDHAAVAEAMERTDTLALADRRAARAVADLEPAAVRSRLLVEPHAVLTGWLAAAVAVGVAIWWRPAATVAVAATILTGLVPLLIYFVSGRLFVRGIAAGAVKG